MGRFALRRFFIGMIQRKANTMSIPTTEQIHDNFVRRYRQEQKKKTTEEIRRSNAGRKPIPDSEKREKNKVSVYLNDEEMEIVREYVGGRSISDVIRNLVLNAASK